MAKTLVIKDADFSVNKLDTVIFADVPCEGVSIPSVASISGLGSTVITPTLTPANTTDTVRWSSSDNDVAEVVGGVVTAKRYGTVTITVTCGDYSASCTVTISIPFVYAKNAKLIIDATPIISDRIRGELATNNRFIALGAQRQNADYPVDCLHDTGDIAAIYPIKIPVGATTITINADKFAWVFTFMASETKGTITVSNAVRDSAMVLDGETPVGGNAWSIASWTFNTRSKTIPIIDGVDSFSITLYTTTASSFEGFDSSNVEIIFGYDDVA